MKRLKHLTLSVLILIVLLLACYSILPLNNSNYGSSLDRTLYAEDDLLWPPPKRAPINRG